MTDPVVSPQMEALIADFARSGLRELHIRCAGFELYLSADAGQALASAASRAPRRAAALPAAVPIRAATTPAVPEVAPLPPGATIVAAPNLGTFYRAPKPGAANYVEIGSTVAEGDELCLIEVMKLFTAVRAPTGGVIYAVLATDGAMVSAGQPLFAIVAG